MRNTRLEPFSAIARRLGRRGKAQGHELGLVVPGAVAHMHRHAKEVVALGRRVVVVEVVEHLLDAHGAGVDLVDRPAVTQHAAEVAVAGRVHVGRDGGERTRRCRDEALLVEGVILFGVEGVHVHIKLVDLLRSIRLGRDGLVLLVHDLGVARVVYRVSLAIVATTQKPAAKRADQRGGNGRRGNGATHHVQMIACHVFPLSTLRLLEKRACRAFCRTNFEKFWRSSGQSQSQ